MQTELIPVTAADVEHAAAGLAEAKRDLDRATAELAEVRQAHKEAKADFDQQLGDWVSLRRRLAAQRQAAPVPITAEERVR